MCCARLAGNAGLKKSPQIRHLGTITQLCRAMFLHLRHVSTIGKKLVKQQCLPHMSSQCGELRPTTSWDLLASLRHPCKFERVSRLGSVTARHSSSGRQPNFAALNRGHHLYSAGWPSRWALAHISSCYLNERNGGGLASMKLIVHSSIFYSFLQVHSCQFVVSLTIFTVILSLTHGASEALQSSTRRPLIFTDPSV